MEIVAQAEEELLCYELVIENGIQSSVEMAVALLAIQSKKLYSRARGYKTFEEYCKARWEIARSRAYQIIDYAKVHSGLKMSTIVDILPANESQTRPLISLSKDEQIECWNLAVEIAGNDAKRINQSVVERAVQEYRAIRSEKEPPQMPAPPVTVQIAPVVSDEKPFALAIEEPAPIKLANPPKFNRTNDNVEWALWTWNPVTGCLHDCPYCYARDIANRHYPQKFAPTFHENRIHAPRYMKVPEAAATNMGEKNVFVCSMADLFGKWVPRDWIDAVLDEVRAAPQWNFLFLTKFPARYEEFAGDLPSNAWIGTTVDRQWAVQRAEKAFRKVMDAGHQGVRWLSCEPMLERLTFTSLEMFNWVVVGGASRSTQTPEFKPPSEWWHYLWNQAERAGAAFYMKTNLGVDHDCRERQYPWDSNEGR